VDEQHRFWVEQRKALEEYASTRYTVHSTQVGTIRKNNDSDVCTVRCAPWIVPHRLNMSATPIPRSLALTLYGDQDISVLDEYPAGRLPIHTKVVKEEQRWAIYNWIDEEVKSGRQVYWISPLVEESESLDIASATNMQEILSGIFPHLTIGLIHGKMTWKEKDRIMQEFYENKIHILSSTSVVEVWVNNPNATVICIEASERFGLSQLHQFRGRVGRGSHQSYCYLFTTKEYKSDRLKAMEKTNDGFELAQIDLDLRWPGEVYGVRQSGVPDFHFADLRDTDLIAEIRQDIEEWMRSIKK
jgi:ATP-dependent DNA helicase RecG